MVRTLKLGILSLGSMFLLTACSLGARLGLSETTPGQNLAPGEHVNFHFFTKIPNFYSGIALQAGARYQLDFVLLSSWIDGTIQRNEQDQKLDERGFANSLMPYEWMGMLRRERDHRWFELMLVQPNCKASSLQGITDLSVDEGSGSYNFVAACDGNLTLFVNDSYGFYSNNAGYANIALSRVN
jgi:hypothetical protein